MPRYGAIFNGIRLSDAGDRTGWLGMSDSNWRIRPRAIRLQFCDNLARVGANPAAEILRVRGAGSNFAALGAISEGLRAKGGQPFGAQRLKISGEEPTSFCTRLPSETEHEWCSTDAEPSQSARTSDPASAIGPPRGLGRAARCCADTMQRSFCDVQEHARGR
jgi:hypothetical protein